MSQTKINVGMIDGSGTPGSGNFLRGDGSWQAAGGDNTPAFQAYLSADQTVASSDTWTKVEVNTEVFDSDGTYDNSTNYRFTPAVAGKYFVNATLQHKNSTGSGCLDIKIGIYLNGSLYMSNFNIVDVHVYYSPGTEVEMQITTIMTLTDSDYIELWGSQKESGSSTKHFATGTKSTSFGAYKMIGL